MVRQFLSWSLATRKICSQRKFGFCFLVVTICVKSLWLSGDNLCKIIMVISWNGHNWVFSPFHQRSLPTRKTCSSQRKVSHFLFLAVTRHGKELNSISWGQALWVVLKLLWPSFVHYLPLTYPLSTLVWEFLYCIKVKICKSLTFPEPPTYHVLST